MNRLFLALAACIFVFSGFAFAEIQAELISPTGGTVISKNANNEFFRFSFSDSNESENLAFNFGYHYYGQEVMQNILLQSMNMDEICQDEDNNSATLQECSLYFDSLQMISAPIFLDLQVIGETESKDLSTAEIVINNVHPKVTEFSPEGKTSSIEIKFALQSDELGIDISKIKVITNDEIEQVDWAEKCLGEEGFKIVRCDWNSDLVKEGENFVHIESKDMAGNGSYASAESRTFIYEKSEDKNPPKIRIDYPENNSVLPINVFEIKFSVWDDESGINASVLLLDSGMVAMLEPNAAEFELSATEGDHNFTISTLDNAGNYAEQTISFSIKKPAAENQPAALQNEQENQLEGGESFPWLRHKESQNINLVNANQTVEGEQAEKPLAVLEEQPVVIIPLKKQTNDKNAQNKKQIVPKDLNLLQKSADENKDMQCLLELIEPIKKANSDFSEITVRYRDSIKIYRVVKAEFIEKNKLLLKWIDCYELENKILENSDYIIDIIDKKGIPIEKNPEIPEEWPERAIKSIQEYLPLVGFFGLGNEISWLLLLLILILLGIVAKKALERKKKQEKKEFDWFEEQ